MTKSIIENIRSNNVVPYRTAALYYKTEPFCTDISKYTHTNNWEILRSVELLVEEGFSVDLIDRNNNDWIPKKKYDLFLGLGVGNSGKNFVRYAKASGAKIKVLLSMGPQPDVSNELVVKRYNEFNQRTGSNAPPMRTVAEVVGSKFLEIISETDFILNIGEPENQSFKSYLKYNKPILNFYPAVSPLVLFNKSWISTRDTNSYLCFAGNGLICKGVDVVTEAFLRDPTKKLHICGPPEEAFFRYYGDKISKSSNIKYHGFIEPGGNLFNDLASKCAFVIFHSAAEGCCTSVATAMKAGLVPVINPWTGINVENCGITLKEDGNIIDTINEEIGKIATIKQDEYENLVNCVIKKSMKFSQESYTESYKLALQEILRKL
jgi:glycosyltransferase involved in cell wall biosynthesis